MLLLSLFSIITAKLYNMFLSYLFPVAGNGVCCGWAHRLWGVGRDFTLSASPFFKSFTEEEFQDDVE